MASVALVTHEACLAHDPGPGHPESPARLAAVMAALATPDFVALRRVEAPRATDEAILLVHSAAFLDGLRQLAARGGRVDIDADTIFMQHSLEAALRAAGGALRAVDIVVEGAVERAFVAARPPGHHAEPDRAMGFCLLSNAAIAARHAQTRRGLRRVAVIDFDVHHGNGTQTAFASSPDLLYVSSHQMHCYPGTGAATETGLGNLVNLPLPPGAGSALFREAWQTRGLPAITAFAPELLIISAGFDAHHDDPLAQISLRTEDFSWLTGELVTIARTCCAGRIVSLLEGGYDLSALSASVAAHVATLMQG